MCQYEEHQVGLPRNCLDLSSRLIPKTYTSCNRVGRVQVYTSQKPRYLDFQQMTKAWLESFIQKKSAQPVSLLKCVGEAAPFRSSTKGIYPTTITTFTVTTRSPISTMVSRSST